MTSPVILEFHLDIGTERVDKNIQTVLQRNLSRVCLYKLKHNDEITYKSLLISIVPAFNPINTSK